MAHFLMKSPLRVSTQSALLASLLSKASWSLSFLENKIVSGVAFAGFDGDLSDRLDWWAAIGYYDSSGQDHEPKAYWRDAWMGVCYKRLQSQFERGFE